MKKLHIEISGCAGTGKTTVQQVIAAALRDAGCRVGIDWGPDGNPYRTDDQNDAILGKIGPDLEVVIATKNLPRERT